MNQEYSEDVEFILVDDQSIDKTKKIIQNAEQTHPQIKYVSSDSGIISPWWMLVRGTSAVGIQYRLSSGI